MNIDTRSKCILNNANPHLIFKLYTRQAWRNEINGRKGVKGRSQPCARDTSLDPLGREAGKSKLEMWNRRWTDGLTRGRIFGTTTIFSGLGIV